MMNYLDTAPANLPAFSFWPDALAVSEEMAAWAQPAAYPQPEVDGDNIPPDILDSVLAWGQSGRSCIEAPTSQTDFSTNWTSGGTVAEGSSSHSVPLLDATAVATPTSAPDTMPLISTSNMDLYAQDFFFPQPDFPVSRTPSLTNGNSLPSPQGDGPINGFLGLPHPEVGPSFSQQPGLPLPQFDIFGALAPEHLTCAPPSWSTGGGNSAGQVQSDSGPLLGLMQDMAYPAKWDLTQLTGNLVAPTEGLATMATSEAGPSTSLGKRSHQCDEAESGGPKKRAKPSARVPGGVASTKRTHQPFTTRTRRSLKESSKAAGRGAERLASTIAQGVSPRSLPGLSVPQGSMGALEHEQPSWIVGREQMGTRRDTAPQQISLQESSEDGEDLHQIPGNLSERERSMLQVTQAEREHGAVRTIRCKLCLKAPLGKWATFQRHCKTCKKHPFALNFCRRCGDYFTRSDSRDRHEKEVSCNTSHHDAMQKKEKVERLFKAFNARLTHCLKNGEKIQPMFSDAMSKILTNTSNKVSKTEEISLEGTWAAGLC